jgi:hypothetical protein
MEIYFGSRMHMVPPPEKHISNCQKNQQKTSHLHLNNLCVVVQFREKLIFFYNGCKKDNMSHKKSYF